MSFSMVISSNRLTFFAYLQLVRGVFLLGILVSFSKSFFFCMQMFSPFLEMVRGMFLLGMRMSFSLCTFFSIWMFCLPVYGEGDVLVGNEDELLYVYLL
jgi:hypothetical protein